MDKILKNCTKLKRWSKLKNEKINKNGQKYDKKIVKVCLHSNYTVQNSVHFHEFFNNL